MIRTPGELFGSVHAPPALTPRRGEEREIARRALNVNDSILSREIWAKFHFEKMARPLHGVREWLIESPKRYFRGVTRYKVPHETSSGRRLIAVIHLLPRCDILIFVHIAAHRALSCGRCAQCRPRSMALWRPRIDGSLPPLGSSPGLLCNILALRHVTSENEL